MGLADAVALEGVFLDAAPDLPGELDGLYSSPPKRGASQNQILLFEREEVPEARSPQDYQVRPFVREETSSLSMLVITVSNDSKASGGYTQRC